MTDIGAGTTFPPSGTDVEALIREFKDMFYREQKDLRCALADFAQAQRQLASQVARVASPWEEEEIEGNGQSQAEEKGQRMVEDTCSPQSCSATASSDDEQAQGDLDDPRFGSRRLDPQNPKNVVDMVGSPSGSLAANAAVQNQKIMGRMRVKRAHTDFLTEERQSSMLMLSSTTDEGEDDDEGEQLGAVQKKASKIVQAPWFSYATSMAIFINSIIIGIEIDMSIRDKDMSFVAHIEHVFLFIYILELGLRFVAFGSACFRNTWIVFDLVLVLIGILTTWIIIPISYVTSRGSGSEQFTNAIQQVLLLRTVRLLRLARALRLIPFFKPLWKLVQGILGSASTMTSAFLLIFLTIYIFACLGGELITKQLVDDEVVGEIVSQHFYNIPTTLLTLTQFVSADSIGAIYVPLIMRQPLLLCYFVPLVLLITIIVMNLVTAIIVEEAISREQSDSEMETHYARLKMKELVPSIRKAFQALDNSNDGVVELKEICNSVKKLDIAIHPELQDVLKPDRLIDLFEFLDLDDSGKLSEDEFVDGVTYLIIKRTNVETVQVLQLLRQMRSKVMLLEEYLAELHGKTFPKSPGSRKTPMKALKTRSMKAPQKRALTDPSTCTEAISNETKVQL